MGTKYSAEIKYLVSAMVPNIWLRPKMKIRFWSITYCGQPSFKQIYFWANVLKAFSSGQMCSGQMSLWLNVFLGKRLMSKCLSGQMSSWQTSYGQMSIWANVFLGKRLLGKCLLGKCCSRQMSFGKYLRANVKCRMGKCCIALIFVQFGGK
jgi:hypothetical protein